MEILMKTGQLFDIDLHELDRLHQVCSSFPNYACFITSRHYSMFTEYFRLGVYIAIVMRIYILFYFQHH